MGWFSDALRYVNPRFADAYEKWEFAKSSGDTIENALNDAKVKSKICCKFDSVNPHPLSR